MITDISNNKAIEIPKREPDLSDIEYYLVAYGYNVGTVLEIAEHLADAFKRRAYINFSTPDTTEIFTSWFEDTPEEWDKMKDNLSEGYGYRIESEGVLWK